MGTMKNAHTISVGKPERKRTLGRPRIRRKDNIRMNLRGCELDSSGSG
jgi:hypothetical protein